VRTSLIVAFLTLALLSGMSSNAMAQSEDQENVRAFPRISAGVTGGYLGIATPNFDQVYGSGGGFTYGAEGSLLIARLDQANRLYVTAQYHFFDKSGRTVGIGEQADATWNQQILNFGVRWGDYTPSLSARGGFGVGVSLVSVEEKAGNMPTTNESATGFYGEVFAASAMSDYLEFTLNIKYDIASVTGHGGLGGEEGASMSVNTLAINAGISVAIF
jgi:hypothetical protein